MTDSITQIIKDEILKQYGSLKRFSVASKIPYSTLSAALAKGIGGTAYGTVTKILGMLNIRESFDDDLILFSREYHDICEKLQTLDKTGQHTVRTVLDMEYDRCREKGAKPAEKHKGAVKGFGGIGYANRRDDEHIKELIRQVLDEPDSLE
ncbi:MAG: hypothetical protein IJ083_00295 [Clostridia bacterium]|nr:hypothetical protein [Clostridia bacterium]